MFSKMFFEVAQWMIHADTATVTLLSIWAAAKFARVEASGLSCFEKLFPFSDCTTIYLQIWTANLNQLEVISRYIMLHYDSCSRITICSHPGFS